MFILNYLNCTKLYNFLGGGVVAIQSYNGYIKAMTMPLMNYTAQHFKFKEHCQQLQPSTKMTWPFILVTYRQNPMVLPLILQVKPNDEAQILLSTWFLYHFLVKHYNYVHGTAILYFLRYCTDRRHSEDLINTCNFESIIWANWLQKKKILIKAAFLNKNSPDYISLSWFAVKHASVKWRQTQLRLQP